MNISVHSSPCFICNFTSSFRYSQSTLVQKYLLENSRNKQFMSFKSCAILNSLIKSYTDPLHPPTNSRPTLDVNHPFVQRIRVVNTTHPLITEQPSGLSDWLPWQCSARIQVTVILQNLWNMILGWDTALKLPVGLLKDYNLYSNTLMS